MFARKKFMCIGIVQVCVKNVWEEGCYLQGGLTFRSKMPLFVSLFFLFSEITFSFLKKVIDFRKLLRQCGDSISSKG